jgi:hypothetical protein
MDNPYIVGHAVKGQHHHGRVDLLDQVLSSDRDCWCIVGLRRFGKTSFLHQLRHLVESNGLRYLPVYWSMQGCEDHDDLCKQFCFYLEAIQSPLEEIGLDLKEISKYGRRHGLVALLWELAARCKRNGRKLLLLCDECEALLRLGPENSGLLGRLRATLQVTELVRTVLIGSRELAQLHAVKISGSPFLDGFEPVEWLPALTRPETEVLVRIGLKLAANEMHELYESTSGHPYFVQALCRQFFEGETELKTAIEKAYIYQGLGLIDSCLEQDFSYLSGDEQMILNTLRDSQPADTSGLCRIRPQNKIAESLFFGLEKSCYIRSGTDGQYTFANAFLEKWLSQRTQQRREIRPALNEEASRRLAEQPRTSPVSRMTAYDDFVIHISSRPSNSREYSVRVLESSAGEASEQLKLKPSSKWIQEGVRGIEGGYQGTKFFQDLGTALFKAVFHGTIGDRYRTSEGRADEAGHGLRLRLRIEPQELLELPWELLFDPSRDRFLARSPHTPLSHYLELPNPHPTLAVTPPLRLLVVVSSPVNLQELGLQELDVAKEQDQIANALQNWKEAKLVAIEMMDNAIVHEVHDRMRHFQPHVVHFIGHGGLISTNGKDQGCLVLEDEQRRYKLVDEEKFCALVDHKISRLVVLNACETAATSKVRGLVGVAPRLVRAGIPAVVAMRYPILDGAAIAFSREFYRALASGLAVDAAVADARKGLFLEEGSETRTDRAWFMPVLFMRAPDGRLFDIPEV